ncbi:SDR family NAD(P)-dependent oxidoreductase [Bacillus cereus group sp. Bc222]|uniref:SDR family NAD(P)-dependent oxidoreductase n=1 Tax=Bacillus cereus group sp. Bc222 TaxID=3018111 RepID=UPI0022E84BEE|nr:SDR family NAD(P)-dependent oxidoreductase [Bacillus cereus group sp. Bc222]MDA2242331.1 SDR family NAD(P)-dependent oxidoreductase [Bacillus cereus group sp. Bc222]
MDKVFEGKVVLITGAASGFGLEFVQTFVKEGAKVIIADLNEEAAQITADQLQKQGFDTFAMACDITKEEQIEQSITHALKVFERIDILVNNGNLQCINAAETSFKF